jgi:hypothetical protein
MRADPKPNEAPFVLDGDRPMVQTHANGPEIPDLLEV